MTKELAVVDAPRQTVLLSTEQLRYIANTEFVPKDKRGNLPAILACVAASRELGIGDMFGINNINVIDGSVSYSAELCTHLVRRAGHSIQFKWGKDSCTATGKRADNGDTIEFTFTLAMAERAGLSRKRNWQQYPEAMLAARAATQVCRVLFSDCFAGGTYTAEELGSEEPEEFDLVDTTKGYAEAHQLPDHEPSLEEPDGGEGGAREARRSAGTGSRHVAETREAETAPGVDRPGTDSSSHSSGSSSDAPPITGNSELLAWALENGITEGVLKAEKFALFPDSKDRLLTPDEIGQLHAALVAKLGQEPLPV